MRLLTVLSVTLSAATVVLVCPGAANAQPYFEVLHSFTGGAGGSSPSASLIQATDGNFYGTTSGGESGRGTVFKMAPDGTVTVLHVFTGGADGAFPQASLIQATDGNFYGTTAEGGGAFGFGEVFRISAPPSGSMSFTAHIDGDPKSDLVIYRPNTGTWDIRHSSSGYSYPTLTSVQWGLPGDLPLVADFDGDGKTDIAVYRPANGGWYILWSSTNYTIYSAYLWGLAGDQPVPADYDGDGKADLAVYRPSTGGWYILQSGTNYASYVSSLWGLTGWGLTGDVPVPGDLDGDRKTDLVVYRPGNGTWYVLFSSSNTWTSY